MQPTDERREVVRYGHAGADVRERILLELAKRDTSDLPETRRAVTEAAAVLVGVARASLWSIVGDELVCDDLFLRDEGRHTSGLVVPVERYPDLFTPIFQGAVVRAQNVHTDARTRELDDGCLRELGIGAMLATPIWRPGGVLGILSCEHVGGPRRWSNRDERDARWMAEVVARSVEASARHAVEARSQAVLEALPQWIVVTDDQGSIIEANALARNIVEHEGGSTIEAVFADLEVRNLAGDVVPRSEWAIERARRGIGVLGDVVEISSRITHLTRWFRVTSAPVIIGECTRGAVGVWEDVEEEIQMERLKREFLTAVAHELRTPTAIVRGYAQRLMDDPGRSPGETRALSAMERASARVARLAEALVDLSAIRLGRIVLSRTHVNLSDVVLQAIQGASASRTHRVRFLPSQTTAPVFIDPMRIGRVVVELIENAARNSSLGSEIDLELQIASGNAQVIVRDHGTGIPAEAQSRMFEPFFRAHAGLPIDKGGLGIGLFLAREIVLRHGGSLAFKSTEGVGSTGTLTLPLDREHR